MQCGLLLFSPIFYLFPHTIIIVIPHFPPQSTISAQLPQPSPGASGSCRACMCCSGTSSTPSRSASGAPSCSYMAPPRGWVGSPLPTTRPPIHDTAMSHHTPVRLPSHPSTTLPRSHMSATSKCMSTPAHLPTHPPANTHTQTCTNTAHTDNTTPTHSLNQTQTHVDARPHARPDSSTTQLNVTGDLAAPVPAPAGSKVVRQFFPPGFQPLNARSCGSESATSQPMLKSHSETHSERPWRGKCFASLFTEKCACAGVRCNPWVHPEPSTSMHTTHPSWQCCAENEPDPERTGWRAQRC